MPEEHPHPDSERLADFALGKLADAEAAQIADHLAGCESCQHAVATVPDDSVSLSSAQPRHRSSHLFHRPRLRPPTPGCRLNYSVIHGIAFWSGSVPVAWAWSSKRNIG